MNFKFFATISVLITGSLLLYGVSDFPKFGDPNSPANAGIDNRESISDYFISKSYGDTHVVNIVTSILADYRGYDTMFETIVVFAAGMSIFAILRDGRNNPKKYNYEILSSAKENDQSKIIVSTTCRLLVPIIQLFALYVIAHGHYSPGGGFQGGLIFASSLIILSFGENLNSSLKRMSERRCIVVACLGIFIYLLFGIIPQFLGSNFLDYGALSKLFFTSKESARSYSILGVEVGVALTVASIMLCIYANLSSKGTLREGL